MEKSNKLILFQTIIRNVIADTIREGGLLALIHFILQLDSINISDLRIDIENEGIHNNEEQLASPQYFILILHRIIKFIFKWAMLCKAISQNIHQILRILNFFGDNQGQ